ncbi:MULTISPECIES: M14 family metallopeptidase [Cellulophaga]|uniref:Peptidase M14 carboxypeptidase A n=1 Tax=Cellulophaga lytica (strain ATCC 23178 / DSM 7489 / JCM 8516 / NBRC 14961 / NCIMB 1423 / VKM B-1433 / Cy l20) TaxID=867900 RepID=F0RAK9_CELLC|nr:MULTISPECIES: M14 family metallopeptidase [Cellulophaga]ADY28402.1 peptidase M14 carboxypeptidase A [Cellulophaga lytica DSM 7489]WQG77420.1 M14 family metallopeptidase [Cellulophaga lytica]
MKKIISLFCFLCIIACSEKPEDKEKDFQTFFETSNGLETPTYTEVIDFYIKLAKEFPQINVLTIGETDSGLPLHLVTYNPDGEFNFNKLEDKTVILINNGIHPGESDGIDATMLLFRDLVVNKIGAPRNTVLTTIPIYNIGGALNRNSTSRTNQNGPKEYGFRGNAQNYDLNRDFIKNDTKNAKTFAEIFHLTKPDIFIDNHVSNGADYQYTLTHLFTQHNKLGGDLGNYLHTEMMPTLENSLEEINWPITPYVNVFNSVPEKGFSQFMDYPRYSTGYTTLWNTLGLMVETHMLKPYKKRVMGTYYLMQKMIDISEKDGKKIKELRANAFAADQEKITYPVKFKIDTTKTSTLNFKGYEADYIESEVTGLTRLKYDRSKPFTKEVIYSNYMTPTNFVTVPEAYIIPKGWKKVIPHLDANKIEYTQLEKDTIITVQTYRIEDYDTRKSAYEGHYPHSNTTVTTSNQSVQFYKGDYYVPTNQRGIRYLLETLEPEAVDSFFNWNFFDTILQQKEGFSPYVFEDVAAKLLKNNPKLKAEFDTIKSTDENFAKNWYAQLNWLHKKSEHYEKAHMQYPIYKLMKNN